MNTEQKKGTVSAVLLVLAAVIWGCAFSFQSKAVETMGAFTINAIRFMMGAVALLPVIAIMERRRCPGERGTLIRAFSDKDLWKGASLAGVFLFIATNLQQFGIAESSAGKAGFITAMYIVLVPLISVLAGKKITRIIWLGVAMALAGLYLLCVEGEFSLRMGDILLILCALAFSFQILAIERYSKNVNGLCFSVAQFAVTSLLTLPFALVMEQPFGHGLKEAMGSILYIGLCSTGVAYTLQIVGQRNLKASVASLIMSLESVFAAVFGALLLGERMTGREILGCAAIFGAILLVQICQPQTDAQE